MTIESIPRFRLNDEELCSKNIIDAVEVTGVALIENFDFNYTDLKRTKSDFLNFCKLFGEPISHDAAGKMVWDIKSGMSCTKSDKVITYSEHSHVADLHTDSQYSLDPEDYFALLTLRQATCGGGESYLLSLDDLISDIRNLPSGEAILDVLYSSDYPFIVPEVFKSDVSNDNEYNFGPILRGNEIRFRVDTIRKSIELLPDYCSKEQISAFESLVNIVRTSKKTIKILLSKGDILLVNNKKMLHGRSSFSDMDRHLLRVRMNKY